MKGWIKLHRKFSNWEWKHKPEMVALWVEILISANYEERKWQGVTLKPGQLAVGRDALAKKTGLSAQTIRTCLNRLKSTNEITIKSTNKFSVITVNRWELWQGGEENQPTNQPAHQQTTNQQLTTAKEYKNNKNIYNKRKDELLGKKYLAGLTEEESQELVNLRRCHEATK